MNNLDKSDLWKQIKLYGNPDKLKWTSSPR